MNSSLIKDIEAVIIKKPKTYNFSNKEWNSLSYMFPEFGGNWVLFADRLKLQKALLYCLYTNDHSLLYDIYQQLIKDNDIDISCWLFGNYDNIHFDISMGIVSNLSIDDIRYYLEVHYSDRDPEFVRKQDILKWSYMFMIYGVNGINQYDANKRYLDDDGYLRSVHFVLSEKTYEKILNSYYKSLLL